MHYQYNSFTGRLIGNQCMHPYFPISANPLSKNEAPKPIFATANQKLAQDTVRRVGTASAPKCIPGTSTLYGEVPEALRKKMEHFQRKDGVPIHLKGGASDKLLFGLTVGLCFVGIASTLYMIYEMAVPKKAKK